MLIFRGVPLEWKKAGASMAGMEIRIDSVEGLGELTALFWFQWDGLEKPLVRVELQNHQLDRHPTAKYGVYIYVIRT